MAFQRVPNTASYRIVMRSNSSAVELNNIVYIRDEVAVYDQDYVEDLAVKLGDHWRDEVMPLISADATFDRVEGVSQDEEFGVAFTAEYNTVGGAAGSPLSAMMCILVQIRGDGGQAPRGGRLFIAPFNEDKIARDIWDATLLSDLQTAVQGIPAAISTIGTSTAAMVLVSRYSGTDEDGKPIKRAVATTNTIASFETRALVATQRDRRTGIGA